MHILASICMFMHNQGQSKCTGLKKAVHSVCGINVVYLYIAQLANKTSLYQIIINVIYKNIYISFKCQNVTF